MLTLYVQTKKKKRFYTAGNEDGYAHGRLHGLNEGRALGTEKGFELWEELGFYEGAARLWAAIFSTDSNGTDVCVPPPSSFTRPSAGLGRVADPLFFTFRVLWSFPS